MLDDFGLQAALEWYVRDFTARYGLNVQLDLGGALDSVPDRHRVCAYRAVQEALTNCIRHADATWINVRVCGVDSQLHITVTDDGVGLDAERRRSGLGLRGIEERVKELEGVMTVGDAMAKGTRLEITLPLPQSVSTEGISFARAAG